MVDIVALERSLINPISRETVTAYFLSLAQFGNFNSLITNWKRGSLRSGSTFSASRHLIVGKPVLRRTECVNCARSGLRGTRAARSSSTRSFVVLCCAKCNGRHTEFVNKIKAQLSWCQLRTRGSGVRISPGAPIIRSHTKHLSIRSSAVARSLRKRNSIAPRVRGSTGTA